jgi:hypothetical protein
MSFPDKNYTIGRGRLFFDDGTGQRYIGNTPSLNLSSESETLDHFDSDNGIKQKDDTIDLSLTRNGAFTTDHISPENLAAFLLGNADVFTTSAASALTQTINDVKLGRRYQLGVSPSNPAGSRGVSNVVVKVGATTMTLNTDYTYDNETGGIIPVVGGTIVEGDDLAVTYDAVVTSRNRVISSSSTVVEGSLLYISNNPKGEKFDYFWPKVKLRPDGDYELKSDEWQVLGFTFEALKKDDNTEVVYVNGRVGSGV